MDATNLRTGTPTIGRRYGLESTVSRSPRASFRALVAEGMSGAEAGSLTALASGLAPVATHWTVDEVERILFLRHLVEHGHLDGAAVGP